MSASRSVSQDANSVNTSSNEKRTGFFSKISTFISDIVSDSGYEDGSELSETDYDPDTTYSAADEIVEDKIDETTSASYDYSSVDFNNDDVEEDVTPAIYGGTSTSHTYAAQPAARPARQSESRSSDTGSYVADRPVEKKERISAVGFDLTGSSVSSTMNSQPAASYTPKASVSSAPSFSGKNASVQIFEPTNTKAADEICATLKSGVIVIVNLAGIPDDNNKIRVIDYLAGCCKGIDATVLTISPKNIYIAAPKGVDLKRPVVKEAEQAQPQQAQAQQPQTQAQPAENTVPSFGFTYKMDTVDHSSEYTPRF